MRRVSSRRLWRARVVPKSAPDRIGAGLKRIVLLFLRDCTLMVECHRSDDMAKTLTVRMDEATYRLVSEAAAAENRSVSNFIETAAKQKAIREIFVSEEEMAGIRADSDLSRRLKRGSREAAARRGRFV